MNDDRAREAVDHLQVAVRELIAAGQAFLSAFEDVVDRPESGRDLLAAIETMAKRFVPGETEDLKKSDDEGGDEGFESIDVE